LTIEHRAQAGIVVQQVIERKPLLVDRGTPAPGPPFRLAAPSQPVGEEEKVAI
jgi:hypothetical protein